MGGAEPKKRGLKLPRGVTLRQFANEDRLQIAFSFKGVECRELTPPGPITQTAINMAAGLRNEVQRKIAEGRFVYAEYFPESARARQFDATGKRILLADKLQDQLTIYEQQTLNKQMSPSTLDGYRKAIKSKRMSDFAEGKTLADVTPAVLREWISGLGVTAKFARNLMTPLRSVLEDALNDDLVEVNPFDRIALKKLLKQTSKPSEYEVDPFTAAERAEILKAARSDERAMVQFWLNTGLRPGELIALRWPKIDWVHNKARIDVNRVAKTDKAPKTEAGIRDVELNEHAMAALVAQKPASYLQDEHVWLNPRTGQAWDTDAQIRRTLWQPLLKRAGVRHRNPYQARHTFASGLLTEGENPWYVAQQLGHVDIQMFCQIYGKFIREDYQRPKATSNTKAPALKAVKGGRLE
jgi:integrase